MFHICAGQLHLRALQPTPGLTYLDARLCRLYHCALRIKRRCDLLRGIRCACAATLADNVLDGQAQGVSLDTQAHTCLGAVIAQQVLRRQRQQQARTKARDGGCSSRVGNPSPDRQRMTHAVISAGAAGSAPVF